MVTVYNEHPSESVVPKELEHVVKVMLEREGAVSATITVILTDHEAHRELHRKFLGRESTTDVLAFPLGDGVALEGEVYVDLDTARDRHAEFDCPFETEVARYVIHGTLHLLGFDDHDPVRKAEMKAKEDEYVDVFNRERN